MTTRTATDVQSAVATFAQNAVTGQFTDGAASAKDEARAIFAAYEGFGEQTAETAGKTFDDAFANNGIQARGVREGLAAAALDQLKENPDLGTATAALTVPAATGDITYELAMNRQTNEGDNVVHGANTFSIRSSYTTDTEMDKVHEGIMESAKKLLG